MDWKDEELADAMDAGCKAPSDGWNPHPLPAPALKAIMTRAVELVAARGGTEEDASVLESARNWVASHDAPALMRTSNVSALINIISAQGARVAVLEEEKANLEEGNRLLAERLSAAEEGNRELVRRAQQAEGLVESLRRIIKEDRLVLTNVTAERDELKARCATISAAGQVPSAHVDKAHDIYMCHVEECPDCKRVTASNRPTIAELEAILAAPEGTYRVEVQPNGEVRAVKRYPCSPTCTHDDAAKPGHPERVKERSEALREACMKPTGRQSCPLPRGHEGECEKWPQPSAMAKELSEAFSKAASGMDHQMGYEGGAEAMRAACLGSVLALCDQEGMTPGLRRMFQAAIEGAAP